VYIYSRSVVQIIHGEGLRKSLPTFIEARSVIQGVRKYLRRYMTNREGFLLHANTIVNTGYVSPNPPLTLDFTTET
jgi:hypothetical protein